MGVPIFVNVISYLFIGLFLLVGSANLINPRFIWKITDGWKAIKGPPASYFLIRRIGGLIALLIPVLWVCYIYYVSHK